MQVASAFGSYDVPWRFHFTFPQVIPASNRHGFLLSCHLLIHWFLCYVHWTNLTLILHWYCASQHHSTTSCIFFNFWEGVAIFFIPRHVALWTIDYDSPSSIQIIPTTNICHGCIYNQSKLQLLTRHSSNLPSPPGTSIIQVKWSKYVFWVSPYPFLPHVSRFNQSTRQWASFLTHD